MKGAQGPRDGVALTGLHRPHGLCADLHARRALHGLHLLWRAPVVRPLHAAVALQGLRSCGCGPDRAERSLLKRPPTEEKEPFPSPGADSPAVCEPFPRQQARKPHKSGPPDNWTLFLHSASVYGGSLLPMALLAEERNPCHGALPARVEALGSHRSLLGVENFSHRQLY